MNARRLLPLLLSLLALASTVRAGDPIVEAKDVHMVLSVPELPLAKGATKATLRVTLVNRGKESVGLVPFRWGRAHGFTVEAQGPGGRFGMIVPPGPAEPPSASHYVSIAPGGSHVQTFHLEAFTRSDEKPPHTRHEMLSTPGTYTVVVDHRFDHARDLGEIARASRFFEAPRPQGAGAAPPPPSDGIAELRARCPRFLGPLRAELEVVVPRP